MSELTFVDELPGEPTRRGGRQKILAEILTSLRSRPGTWARWPWQSSYPKKVTAQIGDGFEVARRVVDGKTVTFVRCVDRAGPAVAIPPPSSPEPMSDPGKMPCPVCNERLAVDAPFGKVEKDRALSKHRIRSRPCDSALKRRTKPR
jgi:hypothetical protein